MLKVVAKLLVKETCVEDYLALAGKMVEQAKNDAGMVYYTVNRSNENPRLFAVLECWENSEALQAHLETEQFKAMAPLIGPMIEQSFPAEFYTEI